MGRNTVIITGIAVGIILTLSMYFQNEMYEGVGIFLAVAWLIIVIIANFWPGFQDDINARDKK